MRLFRRGMARPVSAAWRSRSPWRSATSVTGWSTRSQRGAEANRRQRSGSGYRHGSVDHRGASRPGGGLHRGWRESGATVVVDGREVRVPTRRLLPRYVTLDHVGTEMSVYTDEIFGPVLSVVRAADMTRGSRSSTPIPTPTASRSSRAMVAPRGSSSSTSKSGWSASTCPSRSGRLLLLRWVEGFAFRRPAHVRTRGHQVLYPGQGGDESMGKTSVSITRR